MLVVECWYWLKITRLQSVNLQSGAAVTQELLTLPASSFGMLWLTEKHEVRQRLAVCFDQLLKNGLLNVALGGENCGVN